MYRTIVSSFGLCVCLFSVGLGGEAVTYNPVELPTVASPPWTYTGSGISESDGARITASGMLLIDAGSNQRARWAIDSSSGFAAAEPAVGLTVEIRLRILEGSDRFRGIDLGVYVGDGSPDGDRYFISVSATDVVYLRANEDLTILTSGLDNTSEFHTFRMSITPNHMANVYRDGQLLGVFPASHSIDEVVNHQGSYFQWGEGASGQVTDALIDYVGYDLSGPRAPEARGDCDASGEVSIADAFKILSYKFQAGKVDCLDACDANGVDGVSIADVFSILSYKFSGGPAPSSVFATCF